MNRIGWRGIITRWCLPTYSTRFSHCSTKSAESNGQICQENDESSTRVPPSLPEAECCGDNCPTCVWLDYVIRVKFFYAHDSRKIREAMSTIPNPEIRAFVEMELNKEKEDL